MHAWLPAGLYAFQTIAIDAFPDVTTVLVQVVTKVPGLSPAEVERFVTFPLELQLTGRPGPDGVRSLSKVGLSMITVVFEDDVDIYLARQVVLERVLEVQELLPPGRSFPIGAQHDRAWGSLSIFIWRGPHDDDEGLETTEAELMERRTLAGLGDPAAAQGTAGCRGCQFHGRVCQAVPGHGRAGAASEIRPRRSTTSSTPSPRIMPMPAEIFWRRTTKNISFAAWA